MSKSTSLKTKTLRYSHFVGVLIGVIFSLAFCNGSEKSITIELEYELNKRCIADSVYNMEVVDRLLWSKFVKYIPEEYTNFAMVTTSNEIGLYQIGCVNRSGFRSCTHGNESYLFISHKKSVVLFTDKTDTETPFSYLDGLEGQGLLSVQDKKSLQEQIKAVVTVNRNAVANKSQKRW